MYGWCLNVFLKIIYSIAKYIIHCRYSIENNIASDIRLSLNVWSTRDLNDDDVSCNTRLLTIYFIT